MRSEMVKDMGNAAEMDGKPEDSYRSCLVFRGPSAENKGLRTRSCCVLTVHFSFILEL